LPKETYLHRYSLILNRLERSPATFEQLNRYLEYESQIHGENYIISQRTLQRDIKDIESLLRIEIVNEKKHDKRYFIKYRPESIEYTQRLLESYEISHMIRSAKDSLDHIIFETRKGNGLEHFYVLLNAIKNKKIINFSHFEFWEEVIYNITAHPLALKESIGRWYLLAVDAKDDTLKRFGLDRLNELEISKTSFRNLYEYNIRDLFTNSFGIIIEPKRKAEKVKLSFSCQQGQYVNTYPLHHSQKLISDEENEMIFELNISVTHDFIMEILSFGKEVTVLSPKSLITKIKKIYNLALNNYR
jgi:proteasome accessory factor B